MLWFDVESINFTTNTVEDAEAEELWFDVESINFTTAITGRQIVKTLWFDVESINFTTYTDTEFRHGGCGLM